MNDIFSDSGSVWAGKFQTLLAGVLALPDDANPFSWLRTTGIPDLIKVPTEPWADPLLHALQGIYAANAIMVIIGLFVRWRHRQLALVKRVALPGGSLFCLHPTNCFFAFLCIDMILGQLGLWCTINLLNFEDQPTFENMRYGASYLLGIYTFSVLVLASWCDCIGVLASCITTHFRVDGHLPSYAKAIGVRNLNIIFLGWPIAVMLAGLGVFIAQIISVVHLRDAFLGLAAVVTAQEAAWSDSSDTVPGLADLTPFLYELADKYRAVIKIAVGALSIFAGHIVILLLIWIPASTIQIRMLLRQIHFLRETKKISTVSISLPTVDRSDLLASPDPAKVESKTSFIAKMKGLVEPEQPDRANKQVNKLMKLCWQRIIVSVVFVSAALPFLTVSLGAAIGLTVAINLATPLNLLCQVGSHISDGFIGFPLSCWYFIRSFDKTANAHWDSSGGGHSSDKILASPSVRHRSPQIRSTSSFYALRHLVTRDDDVVASGPLEVRVEVDRATRTDTMVLE